MATAYIAQGPYGQFSAAVVEGINRKAGGGDSKGGCGAGIALPSAKAGISTDSHENKGIARTYIDI